MQDDGVAEVAPALGREDVGKVGFNLLGVAVFGEAKQVCDAFEVCVDGERGIVEAVGANDVGGLACDAGELDEAKRRIADVAVHPNRDYLWLVSMQMFAEAAHRTGRADLCEHIHDELAPFERCVGMIASGTLLWGPVALSLAYAADGCGRTELVEGHLRVARDVAARIPMPFALDRADAFEVRPA